MEPPSAGGARVGFRDETFSWTFKWEEERLGRESEERGTAF